MTDGDRLLEEMGELIQAIIKARRFGYFDWHPDTPELTNIKSCRLELNDVEIQLNEYRAWLDSFERIYSQHATKEVQGE